MSRSVVLLLVLVFLAASCLIVAEPAFSADDINGFIIIREDGSIEGTDRIQRVGNIYTFTAYISAGIQVQKSNIIVDGAGYTLQGDGVIHGPTDIRGIGLEIVECENVTIRKLNIKEFTRGIRFTNSFDCKVYQNSLTNNSIGIEMGYVDESYSNNNTLSGNLIKENNAGIRIIYGSSNTISGNIITANDEGISIWGTFGNKIVGNNITSNHRGIYIETSGINIINQNNFVDNTNDWWDYGLTPWPFQLPFSVNSWDDGKEGNYWDIYYGADNNGDGIGDTPHELYENNADNYPLMNPVAIPEFPAEASNTPTVPEFTLAIVASSLQVTIKNQPITVFVDTNSSNSSLYYGFRFKDHENIQDWNYDPPYYVLPSSYGTLYEASNSDYTVVSFTLESYPLTGILGSGKIDVQVMALIGNEFPTNYENGTVYGFDGVTSVWSSTQTIAIDGNASIHQVPFSTLLVVTVIVTVVAVVTVGFLVYVKKLKR